MHEELLTSDKWFCDTVEKALYNCFEEDVETYEYWIIGIGQDHIFRLSETNFEM